MLNSTMNPMEIAQEVYTDLPSVLNGSRLMNFRHCYDRERKRKRIDPRSTFPSSFPIQSRGGNNWMIVLSKPPSVAKYKRDPGTLIYAYHQTDNGFTVFKPMANPVGGYSGLAIYQESVFFDYEQKMECTGKEPFEVMKQFIFNNSFATIDVKSKEDGSPVSAWSKEGVLRGTVECGCRCIVYASFFSKNEAEQSGQAQNPVAGLENIISELFNDEEFDRTQYDFYADIVADLTQ